MGLGRFCLFFFSILRGCGREVSVSFSFITVDFYLRVIEFYRVLKVSVGVSGFFKERSVKKMCFYLYVFCIISC